MADDGKVIDLDAWLARRARRAEAPVLGLVGVDGEYHRCVAGLWRMAYVAAARWAGVVRVDESGADRRAVVVVDTGRDPARPGPPGGWPARAEIGEDEPGSLRRLEGGRLFLPLACASGEARWYVLLDDRRRTSDPTPRERETLLFGAGECSGILQLVASRAVSPDPRDPSDV